ncbi:Por secretion system C-terminal sorting domain-containing protein [Dyadobacter sp. SG02]|uniref:T9SS type A sorting domain-containing protein n=1 Tax=Dyadobacter sp. SG02 TaxID=1855291 RepID=UPI0008ABD0C9|nr:T9SS type A sorting domain-containing protein [Dyadobacter sp. SG02]SEJ74340.1 Por secretion system C-terminal sorting domain-containing protein [Dyadobacter sp. SG02]
MVNIKKSGNLLSTRCGSLVLAAIMKMNFVLSTTLLMVIIGGNTRVFAQGGCYGMSGCQDYSNFGYASTTAATLEYDNYVSAWHSSGVRDIDGTFKVWGELSQASGAGAHMIPTAVNATNYPGLTGTPLKLGVGSSSRNNVQFVMLTDDNKLWVWGRAGAVVDASLTTNIDNVIVETGQAAVSVTPFQQLSLGLPSGVTASNVKMMYVGLRNIVITTCNEGNVYVLAQNSWLSGPGGSNTTWAKVQKDATAGGGDLSGIVATRGAGGNSLIALDNSGGLWVWGVNTWNGISTSAASRNRPVPMALPSGATGNIKMVGATNAGLSQTYYVLYENGNLYALGSNTQKQLGNWDPAWVEGSSATDQSTWVQPRYGSASGAVMNDIKWLSPNEHDSIYGFINVLTNGKKIYNWGEEGGYALGRGVHASVSGATPVDPGQPISFESGYSNDQIISLETGGHTTMMLRECEDDFGYMGHRIHGSMGDNIDADVTDNTVHFRTSAVQVCGAVTTDVSLSVSTAGPYIAGTPATFVGIPAGGTYSIDASLTTATGATINSTTGVATVPNGGTLRVNYNYSGSACGPIVVNQLINIERMISIPGNVWIDADGDGIIDGGENATANGFWANLLNAQGEVIVSVPVNADGTYNISLRSDQLTRLGDFTVVLTNSSQAVGAVVAAGAPQNGYQHTGTNRGGTTSVLPTNNTGSINVGSLSSLPLSTTSLNPVNFGIQTPPVADPKAYIVANSAFSSTPPGTFPPVTGYQAIPANSTALVGTPPITTYPTLGSLSGSDREDCISAGDCNTGTSTTFTIEAINLNTKVYYDFGSGPVEVTGDTDIPNFNVNNLVIYGENGAGMAGSEFGFTYSITDKAGVTSQPVSYIIQTESALPVTLISFNSDPEGQTVKLTWRTSNETNSEGFEVQRSRDSHTWMKIGHVESQNSNSNAEITYQFDDTTPLKGINYYRLKMIDLDGTFAYSRISSLLAGKPEQTMTTYPNPVVNGRLTINVSFTGLYHAEVYNLSGVRVLQNKMGMSRELNVSKLASGMYVLRVKSATGEVETSTFVVK